MTSKKSLIVFSYVLFVSLCSPIRTETTKTEHIARALGYGFYGMGISFNFSNNHVRLSPLLFLGSVGTDIGMDVLFSESDRSLIDVRGRFGITMGATLGSIAGALAGLVVGSYCGYDNSDLTKFVLPASFIGAATTGFISGHDLEKNIYQELKKLTARKTKEREQRKSRESQ